MVPQVIGNPHVPLEMYICPKCGNSKGFIEVLTHCIVTRLTDTNLTHIETIDWEPTGDTFSTYECVRCGVKFYKDELEKAVRDEGIES